MSQEVIAAFIALGGVVFSVIASAYISLRQTNTELQKLKSEIAQTYTDKLLEERLKFYPDGYYLLTSFAKKIWKESISIEDLMEFDSQVNSWNSKYGILFSGNTNIVAYKFYRMMDELVDKTEDEVREMFMLNENKANLVRSISELELALKSDIGIYIADNKYGKEEFRSYQELTQAVTNRRMKKY